MLLAVQVSPGVRGLGLGLGEVSGCWDGPIVCGMKKVGENDSVNPAMFQQA